MCLHSKAVLRAVQTYYDRLKLNVRLSPEPSSYHQMHVNKPNLHAGTSGALTRGGMTVDPNASNEKENKSDTFNFDTSHLHQVQSTRTNSPPAGQHMFGTASTTSTNVKVASRLKVCTPTSYEMLNICVGQNGIAFVVSTIWK